MISQSQMYLYSTFKTATVEQTAEHLKLKIIKRDKTKKENL